MIFRIVILRFYTELFVSNGTIHKLSDISKRGGGPPEQSQIDVFRGTNQYDVCGFP